MLEKVEYLRGEPLEVLVVLENLANVQFTHFFAEAFARLRQDFRLETRVHIVLDVDRVLLADLHEHADVVLVVGVLLLIRVQQVLIFLKVANYFPVDSLVLQRAVQNNKHLRSDGPVVQVGDVAFKDELKCANGTHLVLVLSIQTFQQI